jgi:phosphoribosyl-ATP pyrophosphohydrolase
MERDRQHDKQFHTNTKLDNKRFVQDLHSLQVIQAHFCELNGLENTPEFACARLFEEIGECGEAVVSGDLKEIKGELADLVIFSLTIANTLEIDLDRATQRYLYRDSLVDYPRNSNGVQQLQFLNLST